jgi:crotonobetainyl-CoA:carnitine CoA-transferase CaiB-like acyl-CoA transferase
MNMKRLPLEDIRILDFTWMLAGPHGTRMLADLGAQVIKVESKSKIDGTRRIVLREGNSDPIDEPGGEYQELNYNKVGLALNLKSAKGKEILEKLVKISDVVTANFDPNGFKKLGLSWENLKVFNPEIIVISMPALGNWGTYSGYMAFGPNLAALSGLTDLLGYPGEEPVGPGVPYADYISGATLAFSVLSALEYRRKTGKGQFVDISQFEVVLSTLGSSLMNWTANKKTAEKKGNSHPANIASPHNCYKCKGVERYCVISVASDSEWENFCKVLGNPDWTKESKFSTHLNRLKNQQEMDGLIESWTQNYTPEEITERMQRAGVSAGVVQNAEDLIKHDHHLRERFLVDLELPDRPNRKPPSITLPGHIIKLMESPTKKDHAAPARMGENNMALLEKLIGMTQQEYQQALSDGAFN